MSTDYIVTTDYISHIPIHNYVYWPTYYVLKC